MLKLILATLLSGKKFIYALAGTPKLDSYVGVPANILTIFENKTHSTYRNKMPKPLFSMCLCGEKMNNKVIPNTYSETPADR